MNAFISYSIADNEQYILTLLSQKVSEIGLTLVTSYDQGDWPNAQATDEIKNAAVFIGLMTTSGRLGKRNRVYSEFKQANMFGRPAILLIEDTIPVLWEGHYHNTIRFNRHNIGRSIQEVNNRIANSQQQIPQAPNAAAWILAGIGVLALLSLLSSDKN
jgi:hypothetical protein